MQATMWTVVEGTEPQAIPVELIGIWKNAWGPKQDIILGRMGGIGERTGPAAGMSGSPVYVDGKLIGALSLQIGNFTREPICGITPIELMLEIDDLDRTRPADARGPGSRAQALWLDPSGVQWASGGGPPPGIGEGLTLRPIDTPISLSGFGFAAVEHFGPLFRQMGVSLAQGGAAGSLTSSRPAPGWEKALRPGDAVNQILVAGDMTMSALCTVSYNDGRRILACGHPVLNTGKVDMPIAKGEILMVLGSQLNPVKIGNATEVVGALRQDRHSAIAGELGAQAQMIPVELEIRQMGESGQPRSARTLRYEVFVDQKWTPVLMLLTVYNSITSSNEFSENTTYKVSGEIALEGGRRLPLSTLVAPMDIAPMPPQLQMASWWADKFNQLFQNPAEMPKLDRVRLTVDLVPERRIAAIESAYLADARVTAGSVVPVKVFLRPYRGPRIETELRLTLPAGLAKGEYRVLLSDGDTLNRLRASVARGERPASLEQTVSLLQQERRNNRLYLSLIERSPTAYVSDQAMPNLPASALNVLQSARAGGAPLSSQPESITEQASPEFDFVVSGSYVLRVQVN
jgi:hypothetical protein